MIVREQIAHFDKPLNLRCGKTFSNYDLVYETYGTLNQQKNNAILICHALTGNHHAAGVYENQSGNVGWWDELIGEGKTIDTNKFFVVCCSNLGTCFGSTSAESINPATNKIWGGDFPTLCVEDWVDSQKNLADFLGIDCWVTVIGGSLGGMQVISWALQYPQKVKNAIILASGAKLPVQHLAFSAVGRQAIMRDPYFNNGNYYQQQHQPDAGLAVARMMAHITYLCEEKMESKFGHRRTKSVKSTKSTKADFNANFEVENYLTYQGQKFINYYDANAYLLVSRATENFDPAKNYADNLSKLFALSSENTKFLVISFDSDWFFPPKVMLELVKALLDNSRDVCYAEIDSDYGHDSFLLPIPHYMKVLRAFLDRIEI